MNLIKTNNQELKKGNTLDCQSWTPEQWESYLLTLEKQQGEILLDNYSQCEEMSNETHQDGVIGLISEDSLLVFNRVVNHLLSQLTEKQRQIIHLIFWEGKNLKEISKKFGVSRVAVLQSKDRAIAQMTRALLKISTRNSNQEKKEECA